MPLRRFAVRLLGEFPGSAQAVAAYRSWAEAVTSEDDVYLAERTAFSAPAIAGSSTFSVDFFQLCQNLCRRARFEGFVK